MVIRTVLGVKEEEHKLLPQKPPLEILKNMMNCGMVSVVPWVYVRFPLSPFRTFTVFTDTIVSFKVGII